MVPTLFFALLALLQQPTWMLGGNSSQAYTLVSTRGSALDRSGATIALRSDTASTSAVGSITGSAPADSFRRRRVRIIADIETKNVVVGASAWLRVDGPSRSLVFDYGSDDLVKGTSTGHREITLYVPAAATRIAFGLLLTGPGEATAKGLRIEAQPMSDVNAPLAPPAQRVLDSAITIVRANSLWRDTVTWSQVLPEVYAAAAGAQSTSEVHPAIAMLLARLGDHHSFIMKPQATQQFQTGGTQNPRPIVQASSDSIGYISVPAYSGGEKQASLAYAKDVQDSLASALPRAGCKWVVDLRRNGGGNMWPMLGGLRPFLGEVGLGSFVSAAGSAPLWRASAVDVKPTPALAALDSAYVAVLTGPRTASSGEAVTISFRGRPRTRSFGLPTAGLSTANQNFLLPDGSMILLTVSVEADRTGRRYGEKIDPDEVIPEGAPGTDVQLDRAKAWLKSQPSCKR
ncbi:MAG TPA: S41 family peptidase [Gemmatimonadaceae bacterium]